MNKMLVIRDEDDPGSVDVDATRENFVRAVDNPYPLAEEVAGRLISELADSAIFPGDAESAVARAWRDLGVLHSIFDALPWDAQPDLTQWQHAFIEWYHEAGALAVALDGLSQYDPEEADRILKQCTCGYLPEVYEVAAYLNKFWRFYTE